MPADDLSRSDRPLDDLRPEQIRLPGFRMIRELGRGGMGVVFLAQQASLEREVAVKLFPTKGVKDTNLQRFFREVQLCVALSHPHVVKLIDAGATEEWAWLAMEYVTGEPLDRHVYTFGPLKPAQLAIAMEELADALDFVHEHKIVHRDIKPANVMKPTTGGLKLMDFGLARMEQSPTLTDAGAVVGSPRYLAPETVTSGKMDMVSDLYGLGFLIYEIATGTRPYDNRSLRETLAGIVREPLPPPSQHQPSVPTQIDDIVMKLLAKQREKRYQSTGELLADVRKLRASPAFVGTSWETSRPELNLSSSAGIVPAAPAPVLSVAVETVTSRPTARPSRKSLARATGSFAASQAPAPVSTARVLVAAAVVGALIGLATIALLARRQSGASPEGATGTVRDAGTATSPASSVKGAAVDAVVQAVGSSEPLAVLARMEQSLGKEPTGRGAQGAWRAKAAAWLQEQKFAEQWRALTGDGKGAALLTDTSINIETRRRLATAALFFLHLDDWIAPGGKGAPFRAAAVLAPWMRPLEVTGDSREAARRACQTGPAGSRCVEVQSNPDELSEYLFYDRKAANGDPISTVAGKSEAKFADEHPPEFTLEGTYREVAFFTLVADVFESRWVQVDLRPLASSDGDPEQRTLAFRPRASNPHVQGKQVLGIAVAPDLVPPGRYAAKIRAFRMEGVAPVGVNVFELLARVAP